jgi:molybdate-binding protein
LLSHLSAPITDSELIDSSSSLAPLCICECWLARRAYRGVAAAVASGCADCELGITAAAQALDLDFIPLFQERYDLVIPKKIADNELLAPLFGLLNGRAFREAVAKLKGYDVSVMGTVILEDE